MSPNPRARARRRRAAAGLLAATAVLATTACAGSDSDTDGSGTGAAGKALVIGYTGGTTTNYDPASGANNYFQQMYPAYDTLLHYGSDGTITPWLATKYSFTDAKTLELTLRDDVTFTDGSKFDASVVKANLEYQRDAEQGNQLQPFLKSITDVKVVDATTVDIVLSAPNPGLPFDLTQAPGEMVSPKAIADPSTLTSAPAGSGPYVLDTAKSRPGVSVVWKRNEDYWAADQDLYPFDSISYMVYSDPTATRNAAQAGDLDLLTLSTSKDAVDGYTTLNTTSGGTGGFTGIWLDISGKTQKALSDVRVRQALNYAIDTDTIAKTVYEGDAVAVPAVPVTSDSPAYSDELAAMYKYDPDKAKSLLSEAGYADGFDMTIIAPPIAETYAQAMSDYLRKVGIKATVKTFEGSDIVDATLSGKYQSGLLLSTPTGVPTQDFSGLFTAGAFFNVAKADDPKMDKLLATAAAETVETKRNQDYQDLALYAAGQAWFTGTVELQQVNAYDAKKLTLDAPPFGSIFPYAYQLPN